MTRLLVLAVGLCVLPVVVAYVLTARQAVRYA